MNTKIVVITGLIVLANSLLSQSSDKYKLKKLLDIGEQTNTFLLSASEVIQSDNGDIFIADEKSHNIKKIDKKGRLLTEFGKKGRKNGEFSSPSIIDYSKYLIAIADYNSTRVQIFNTQFKFISKFNVNGVILDLKFDKDQKLWVLIYNYNSENILLQYDLQGKLLKTIIPKSSAKKEFIMDFKRFCISENGNIFILNLLINKVEKWNIKGKFINEFSIKDVPATAKKKIFKSYLFFNEYIPDGNLFWDISCDSKERVYILSGNYSKHKYQDVYVYSNHGEFINKLVLPSRVSYFWIDSSTDNLFLINKNRTEVFKYSLIFQE